MAAIIALVGRMLLWLVSTYAGQWVLKCLLSLGISIATTQLALPALLSFVQSHVSGLPPFAYQCFGAMGFDVFISMVLSAIVANKTGKLVFTAANR
jgi:hypothetical protein